MRRTTIMLPAELRVQAIRKAESLGISLGELIRKSLQYSIRVSVNKSTKDSLFTDNAIFSGKIPRDLAEHHDRYLYGEKVT